LAAFFYNLNRGFAGFNAGNSLAFRCSIHSYDSFSEAHWELADTLGRKPLLVLFRFTLVSVPFAYAFAPSVYVLIGISAFWGISLALGQASMTAYLIDVIPEEHRGSLTAFHNLLMGITSFFGSLLGGYLSGYTISLFGLTLGLQIVYMVSMAGRGVGAAAHLALKETLKKPSQGDGLVFS
jgi:MFS family permease